MSGSVRQSTRLRLGSNTKITNTYPRKRGRLTNLPLNGNIHFGKDFDKSTLKERIARLKSSPSFREGQNKLKTQLKRSKNINLRNGKTLNVRNRNLVLNIKTS